MLRTLVNQIPTPVGFIALTAFLVYVYTYGTMSNFYAHIEIIRNLF